MQYNNDIVENFTASDFMQLLQLLVNPHVYNLHMQMFAELQTTLQFAEDSGVRKV